MMPGLELIYDRAFFQEWGAGHERYVRSASVITDILYAELQPRRLVDVGCGCGVYSHFFAQKGVDVVAIDGVQPPPEHAFPVPIQIQDLTVPFENRWGAFDTTFCLEVAEHIPEAFVNTFLDNVLQFSDRLLLSAAPPNQGGHHHVNEQPKRYWVTRLAEKGFLYNRKQTGRLMELFKKNKPDYMWMSEHISLYERVPSGKINWSGLPLVDASH